MTSEEENSLDVSLKDLPDLEAGVLLLSVGLYREAITRFDAAASSSAYRESSMYWRAQALATIGLYREAYEDLMKAFER